MGLGKPSESSLNRLQLASGKPAALPGIEVNHEAEIKSSLMIPVGKATGKVRDSYDHQATGDQDSLQFSNDSPDIIEVLEDMIHLNQFKLTIGKRPRKFIQIVNDISRIHVRVVDV